VTICALLVTASLVAVRGLLRSLQSDFGFEPRHALLAETDLVMAGYKGDEAADMQKRMIAALEAIPGVAAVGLTDWPPLDQDWQPTPVFTDRAADLRPVNAAGQAMMFKISPGYFRAAGTALVAGRTFTWHDDADAPRVAVVNQEFSRRLFASETGALGGYYKVREGTRILVVGIVEDGKYMSLTEAPRPAMFLPFLQSPRSQTWLVVRSERGADLAADIRQTLRGLDAGLPVEIRTWVSELDGALFPSRAATLSLGVLGAMGALLSVTGIFGMAMYSVSKRLRELGIRIALGAQRREVLQAALGRALKLLAIGSAAGLLLGILASRVLASIVYHATPRDPLVLASAVLAMLLLGLLATWIPAQRALAVNPLILLREE
jgi:predicted permease